MSLRPGAGGFSVSVRDEPPLHTDWHWRPEGWTSGVVADGADAGPGVRLFHDDPQAEVSLQPEGGDLTLSAPGFNGTFLSLAIDLPPAAITGIGEHHILSVRCDGPRFARLNLTVGPDRLDWTLGFEAGEAAFDLDRALPEGRTVGHGWVDLIFDGAGPEQRHLTGLRLARFPRAQM